MRLGIRLATPLPERQPLFESDVVVDTRETTVTFRTALPGGYSDAEIDGIPPSGRTALGSLPVPINAWRPFAHAELWLNGVMIWAGQVVEANRPAGQLRGLTLEGYGVGAALDDRPYTSTTSLVTTTAGVIRRVMQATAPFLRAGTADQFQDPGVSHNLNEFVDMTLSEVLDQLLKEGGQTLNHVARPVWDWAVWERQTAWLTPRLAPDLVETFPTYRLPWDARVVDWREDYRGMRGQVDVAYGSTPFRAGWVVDETFADRVGRLRTVLLQAGDLQLNGALQFRDAYLATHRVPAITARIALDLGPDPTDGLPLWGGGVRPVWLVRAGETVQIGDHPPLTIVGTEVAFDAGGVRFQATLGDGVIEQAEGFRRVTRDLSKLRQRINLVSGGRMR